MAKRLARAKATPKKKAARPKLLSGGNPQIAKGYGDAPVKAYVAAVPGWQKNIAKRIDALVVKAVPGVKKAVKWNSPFYGMKEGRWFLCFHIFTRYVKVTFFDGAGLKPQPEGKSKYPQVRYYDIREGAFDVDQTSQQAARRTHMNRRRIYLAIAGALLAIEVLIALFVRDRFIRPYVGDMLAITLVYATLRALTPLSVSQTLTLTLAIALAIEGAQALGLLNALGLADNQLARTVLGGVFDWHDLAAYATGGAIIAALETLAASRAARRV